MGKQNSHTTTSASSRGGGGGKRHGKTKDLRDPITKPVIKRLARRGGVKRISGEIYKEVNQVIRAYVEKIVGDGVLVTEHCRRKTIQSSDIKDALARHGRTYYGA